MFRNHHNKLSVAGFAILPAVALLWLGQFIAMLMWDGTYLPDTMYISDLGARECEVLYDATMPRAVCSPGHIFYIIGFQLAGILLLLSATALRGLGVDHKGAASKKPPYRGALISAFGLATVGICLVLNAMLDVGDSVIIHHLCFGIGCAALWVVMLSNAVISLRYQPLLKQPSQPLLNKTQAIITLIILAISVAGYLLFVFSPPPASYGLYQHIAVDSGAVWMLLFASVLIKLSRTKASSASTHA
ncbi:DUF998 domain-containing protein [Corynebacterium pelargi]|uniref:Uncharacterized protein n=1 Tax=Corynebacterium pelargi TaxID=1471400 RepID=A0A410WAV0_9CORY|nr:hypothetical protein [Corynebacterium pelargi]QAU53064.1 hypothetical protein CPELA_09045 [Corynebacterium pelargi]GGG75092.1 hypothetical protein GCM10007338_10750 [Corynebacterium pelargi]